MSVTHADGSDEFKVEVRVPTDLGAIPSVTTCANAEAAATEYAQEVERLSSAGGSGLWDVRLVIGGSVTERQLVVRALPNRL
jgi:hypothetical protein